MTNLEKIKYIKIGMTSLIVILVILLIILVVSIANEETIKNAQYTKVGDIPDNKSAVIYMDCEYIKEEKSTNSIYDLDIYLKFGKPLFDEDKSNEIYYSQLIQLLAILNEYDNFRLIDEQNEIMIAVFCNPETLEVDQIIINGDPYYYSREEGKIELKNYQKTPITDFTVQSNELSELINIDFITSKLNLERTSDEYNGYVNYPMNGIDIKTIKGKAFHIIFNKAYTGNIVNGLNVNSTFEEIIEKLGSPTFGSSDGYYIGYKGNDFYIFFSLDEVSVYRVQNIENNEFAEIVANYLEEKNIKDFVSNVTDIWEDYDLYDYTESLVNLSYILRGIEIQYGMSERHGITIYKNYTGEILNGKTFEELSRENIEIPMYIYFKNSDLVDEYEANRVQLKMVELDDEELDE